MEVAKKLTQIPTILHLPPLVEAILHLHQTSQPRNLAPTRSPKSNFIPTPYQHSPWLALFFSNSFYFLLCSLARNNALGLCFPDRRQTAFKHFKRHKFIILLQETYWTPDLNDIIQLKWNGDIFFSHETLTTRGVALLLKLKFPSSYYAILP